MVGVAGKSQACNTCRSRRVKCDFGRPSCQKCINSGRLCTGYDRNIIFVNRTFTSPSTTAISAISELKVQEQAKTIVDHQEPGADLQRLFSQSSHDCLTFRVYAVELLKTIYLPKHEAHAISDARNEEGSFSWVYRLTELANPSKSLDTSLFAFCLSQLHITGANSISLYECLDQYSIALQQLRSDIDGLDERVREETLAAILVLSTCELFISPTEDGWSAHARGSAELLRVRDPGMTSTPAWRHLFSRLRVICILEAMTKRQAPPVQSELWRRITTEPDLNHALDRIFKMFAGVPAILAGAVALPSASDETSLLKTSAACLQSTLQVVKSVKSWLNEFWINSRKPRVWTVPSYTNNPADFDPTNKVFPFCLEFESLNVAVVIVMCWSVLAQLYSTIIQIYDLVGSRLGRNIELGELLGHADSPMHEAAGAHQESGQGNIFTIGGRCPSINDIQVEGTRVARNICQSMEYYHRIEMGTYGGHVTTYPSWSARQYFRLHPGHEREWSWLQNMHKNQSPGTRWGLSIMKFADIAEPIGGWTK